MAIDNSIYGQGVGNFSAGFGQGNDLRRRRKDELAQKEQMLLAKQKQAMAESAQAAEMSQKKQMNDLDLTSRVAGSIKDQATYEQGLKLLAKQGVDVSGMSPQYNPDEVNMYHKSALSALEQFNQGNKDRDFNYGAQKDEKQFAYNQQKDGREFGLQREKFAFDKTDKNRGYDLSLAKEGLSREMFEADKMNKSQGMTLKEKELALMERDKTALQKYRDAKLEAMQKKSKDDSLSPDVKKTVETLATKNANKTSIANQIDAVMGGWDNLSDDQKVTQGRMLLKTLNSPEGADAIGVEEANRLGSKLEFAMGNFTNSNPTQFGRDLPGFKEQATNAAKFIRTGVDSNQKEIDRAMGRQAQQPPPQAIPDANALNQLPDDELMRMYKQMGGK